MVKDTFDNQDTELVRSHPIERLFRAMSMDKIIWEDFEEGEEKRRSVHLMDG